jgi:hypothetical protein
MLPLSLTIAQQWSLFNPAVHYAHYAALRQTLRQAEMVLRARAATADGAGESAAKSLQNGR